MRIPEQHHLDQIVEALRIIHATPGYADIGHQLSSLHSRGRIRVDSTLEDRAQASLFGRIILGPEVFESNAVSIAQTLVHECFHLRQNPFLKTVSFWCGIATRSALMKRYEQPAYCAALEFLEAVKETQQSLAHDAEREQIAVRQVFASCFGERL